jgi:hypothetical protein
MLRKNKEDSDLIDFSFTSYSQGLITLADSLLKELKVVPKHLPRKRQILITLIVNLVYNYKRGYNTAIPRGENFYSNISRRYKLENISHDITVDLIDQMKQQGKYVIEHFKGFKNEFTEASQYYPSELLVSLVHPILKNSMTFLDEEFILLRKRVPKKPKSKSKSKSVNLVKTKAATDTEEHEELTVEEALVVGLEDEGQLTKKFKKILVDYTDTEYTNSIRKDLIEYNNFRIQNRVGLNLPGGMFKDKEYFESFKSFASIDLSLLRPDAKGMYQVPLAPDRLVRIFTQDFEHGGRFYQGFETQIKKELRPYVTINGEPTVELDYSSYHIRMIYHLNNKRCPEDPYVVYEGLDPEEGRDYYKTMVAACLNNSNQKSVLNTMRQYIRKNNLIDQFSGLTNKNLQKGLNLLLKHNSRIARHFFKGDGLIYHRIDSDIANDILMYFTRLKTPVLILCVHDSFLVPASCEDELRWAMNHFYKAKVRKQPKIK